MSERWAIALAFVGALQLAGCGDDCAHGDECSHGLACVYDTADQTSSDAVCVHECDYDTDCTAPETCTGMGHAATSPIQLIVKFCKAPEASPRELELEEPQTANGLRTVPPQVQAPSNQDRSETP